VLRSMRSLTGFWILTLEPERRENQRPSPGLIQGCSTDGQAACCFRYSASKRTTFKDLKTGQPESLQANLIMPEPAPFLSRKFPICSIIRPTETKGAAMGALRALTDDGLFIGQKDQRFFDLRDLAEDVDEARKESDGAGLNSSK
jgi:hypothetical protein